MIDTEIVQQFARIFAAFEHTARPTTLLGFDLGSAPKQCRPKQLNVLRCDGDDLSLLSFFRDWWVVTSNGIAHHPDWPLPKGEHGTEFYLTSPYLKFTTDGQRIRYGLRLGPDWYCAMQSQLIDFGKCEETIEVVYECKG